MIETEKEFLKKFRISTVCLIKVKRRLDPFYDPFYDPVLLTGAPF